MSRWSSACACAILVLLVACASPPARDGAPLALQTSQPSSATATPVVPSAAATVGPTIAAASLSEDALVATIAAGAQSATAAAPSPTALPPTPHDPVGAMDAVLNQQVQAARFSGAVLVAQGGEVLLRKGYGLADYDQAIAHTPQTRFRLGSISKQFTAMAILLLQAEGKLDVQDRICTYLTDCPATWRDITIHQLLTHTSGIPDFTAWSAYQETKRLPTTPLQTIARFRDRPLEFEPGAQWSYSNSGYILLGYLIEQVSGQSYEVFLQEHIFTPLEMQNTGYDHNDASLATGYLGQNLKADFIDMSVPYAAGGLYSTVDDLYRWDRALYTDALVPQRLLATLFTSYRAIPNSGGLGYGYGWYVHRQFDRQVIGHGGGIEGFRTIIMRYPEDEVVIIVLSNLEVSDPNEIADQLARIVFGAS